MGTVVEDAEAVDVLEVEAMEGSFLILVDLRRCRSLGGALEALFR